MTSQSWRTPAGKRSRRIMSERPALSPQYPTRTYFSMVRQVASLCIARRQNTRTPSPSMPNTPNIRAILGQGVPAEPDEAGCVEREERERHDLERREAGGEAH